MADEDTSGLQWVTVYDRMNAKANKKDGGAGDMDMPNLDEVLAPCGEKTKSGKRLSVERIYQKKSQLEHILLRPDTYIGSVEKETQTMWVWDAETEQMMQREITYVPGLYKIFDEILVNAADNKQRDATMSTIKIDIDPENNKIKIWNNGKGIPVVMHQKENMYVPSLIFGHLLTSSNYDDSQKKVTGGRNGYGAKLCNIFSEKFVVETSSVDYKKKFRQQWQNNMSKTGEPKLASNDKDDYTCITFHPDLAKFKMESLDADTVALFTRRAYDIAAATRGVKVMLNGKRLPVKNFKDYVDLYIKNKVDDTDTPLKMVYEAASDRWEVAIALSEKGFQQVSFVNSIATTKGGRHVDYVTDQIVTKLIEAVKKKEKKGNVTIKPFQVKNHVWVFVNCLIENPTFDSQTKENMTLQAKSFGSKCSLSDKFITQVNKCGIIEAIQSWMRFKQQAQLSKKCSASKTNKIKGIPKLDDANDAGTKNSTDCTLILTEGDSAKTLAVAGLGVVGRDRYGVFPLRGKLLNVREASHKQIMENAEINNMVKIMGLRYKEKYDTPESMKTLRYGRMMIMTDQDQDGSHIKGLLINFIHHNWPGLLRQNFLEEFITPIVKVSKSKTEHSFYSLPEFEGWKQETDNWHTWKVKYYKGLGTSTSKEAKEYFSDMHRHRILFRYTGGEDDASIVLAFSKKKIEERKEWLTNWMDDRKRRTQLGLPEHFLYGKGTKQVTFTDFVNRELILFSNMDNERSIPSLVDGLKPGQRKVLFTCFKRNQHKEVKVAQLAGSVAEHSAYHHGEISLMMTIVGLAQNFVGSNNINLLKPIGQFGTRLHGGKDAASPRYIFTALSSLAKHLINTNDEPLLKHLFDDSQRIEPEWYVPIIPTVLVNGADGIGTGWSTKIPNYDPREIIANLRAMLRGEEPQDMMPYYKNFKGTIEELDDSRFVVNGEVSIINDTTIEITELPVKTWTQGYKEAVLEPMLMGTDKTPAMITDYKEYHTDTTVKFVVKMTPEKLSQAEEQGLHKVFRLQTTISTGSMVLFDGNGCIKRYSNAKEILQEFYHVRMSFYEKRKDYMEGMLAAESLKYDNMARFIMEHNEGKISVAKKPKKEIIQMLVRNGYDSDPIKAWKESQDKAAAIQETLENENEEEESQPTESGPDFNYLLKQEIWSFTKERVDKMLKERDSKSEELYLLRKKTPSDLWTDDLDKLLEDLDAVEATERAEDQAGLTAPAKGAKGRVKAKPKALVDIKPSPMGRRVEPRIDPSLKAKAQATARAQKRKLEKKEKLDMFGEDMDEDSNDLNKSLTDRIGNLEEPAGGLKGMKPKKEKKEKEKKPPREKRPSGSPKKKGGKGGKKRNPWSDEESDQLSASSDEDMDGSFLEGVTAREPTGRRAAAPDRQAKKAKYVFDDDENEGGDSNDEVLPNDWSDDDKEGVISTPPPPTKAARKQPPPAVAEDFNISDDSDFEGVRHSKQPSKRPAAFAESDEDEPVRHETSESLWDRLQAQTQNGTSKTSTSTKTPSIVDSDSDSDEPLVIEPAPKKPEPKPKKTLGKKVDSDLGGKKKASKAKDPKQPSISAAMSKAKPKASKMSTASEDDSGSDYFNSKAAKPAAKSKLKKKPMFGTESESDDVITVASSQATSSQASSIKLFESQKDEAPKKKAAPKRKKKSSDISDFSDDDFGGAKKKAPPKKKAAPKKKKQTFDDSEESEGEFAPKKSTAAGSRKKKAAASDSDDDDDLDMSVDVAPRARGGGRSRAPVKYNFGTDEEGSDY